MTDQLWTWIGAGLTALVLFLPTSAIPHGGGLARIIHGRHMV